MEAILHTFGIDWRLLLINAINFGVLLAALWYFLYTPVMRMLEERRQKVVEGVHSAERSEALLKEVEESRAHKLAEAGKEADELLKSAREAGTQKEQELLKQASVTASTMLKEAEIEAGELKRQALEESKHEVAKLIVLGVEKALIKK